MFKRKKKQPSLQPRVRPIPTAKPQAFSYNSNSNRPAVSEVEVKGRGSSTLSDPKVKSATSKIKRTYILIGAVGLLVLFIVTFSVSTNAKIIIVQPSGFHYQPHTLSQYQSAASKAIGSSIYNRLKFTISSNDIASQLKKVFPEISHAAVSVSLIGATPKVYIQLAKPTLQYTNLSGSYTLNDHGIVISDSSIIPSSEVSALPSVISTSSASLSDGERVLSTGNVLFIQTVKMALSEKKVAISKMNLVPMAEELDVYPTGVSYYVKFNLHETNALQQVGTYLAAATTLKRQGITPHQYIDVRVDGKAYYK